MDINSPRNSKILAILIQGLDFEQREEFLTKAKRSPSIRDFATKDYPKILKGAE